MMSVIGWEVKCGMRLLRLHAKYYAGAARATGASPVIDERPCTFVMAPGAPHEHRRAPLPVLRSVAMLAVLCFVLAVPCASAAAPPVVVSDTIRLEVGSKEVNGRVYAPHAARVRVRIGSDTSRIVTEWTNELTLGDSAGRPIMRWVTRGTQSPPNGPTVTWEILQTYDAVTLAPYGHVSRNSLGGFSRLAIDGRRVRGTRKLPKDSVEQQVDLTIDRPGFIASASDLVPLAVGLKEGSVMTAPVWGPSMAGSELRIFSVIARVPLTVEGK